MVWFSARIFSRPKHPNKRIVSQSEVPHTYVCYQTNRWDQICSVHHLTQFQINILKLSHFRSKCETWYCWCTSWITKLKKKHSRKILTSCWKNLALAGSYRIATQIVLKIRWSMRRMSVLGNSAHWLVEAPVPNDVSIETSADMTYTNPPTFRNMVRVRWLSRRHVNNDCTRKKWHHLNLWVV